MIVEIVTIIETLNVIVIMIVVNEAEKVIAQQILTVIADVIVLGQKIAKNVNETVDLDQDLMNVPLSLIILCHALNEIKIKQNN